MPNVAGTSHLGTGTSADTSRRPADVKHRAVGGKRGKIRGAGWEQTEATVEVAVPPAEGVESREDLIAGPVQVLIAASLGRASAWRPRSAVSVTWGVP
jgi:hypothetical protein